MTTTQEFSWPALTAELIAGRDLPTPAVQWVMDSVMSGTAPGIALGGFLVALQCKGISVGELDTFASTMLAHSRSIEAPEGAVDIVGTGGDGANTVNVSTMSALVVAGAGIPVVKHGNRAVSSKSGSADCLEALGVRLDMDVEQVQKTLDQVGIAFCYAQTFHPSMRYAAEVRQGLKLPTVFNVLGPLTNPARVKANAIGVAFEKLAPVIAGVFAARGSSALVFRGRDGLDELSIATESDVWEVNNGAITQHVVEPEDLGLERSSLDALRGGDAAYNAQVARDLFDGDRGAARDAVVLNSAAGIVAARGLSGADASLPFFERMNRAARLAEESLDSGAARKVLDTWVEATQHL